MWLSRHFSPPAWQRSADAAAVGILATGERGDAAVGGGSGDTDPDPSLEPASVPATAVGGDAVPPGGDAKECAANPAHAVAAPRAADADPAAVCTGPGQSASVARLAGTRRQRRANALPAGHRRLVLDGLSPRGSAAV